MLQLRAFATPERVATAGEQLRVLRGVRHVLIGRNTVDGAAMLTGDVEPESADGVLNILRGAGIRVRRRDAVEGDEHPTPRHADAAVWAEIASRAMSHSRLAGTYLLYMVTAGVVAGVGVLTIRRS